LELSWTPEGFAMNWDMVDPPAGYLRENVDLAPFQNVINTLAGKCPEEPLRVLCRKRCAEELCIENACEIWCKIKPDRERKLLRHVEEFCFLHWGKIVQTEGFLHFPENSFSLIDEGVRLIGGKSIGALGTAKYIYKSTDVEVESGKEQILREALASWASDVQSTFGVSVFDPNEDGQCFKALRYIYNLHLVTIVYRCKRMAPENIIPLWGVYIRIQTLADAKEYSSQNLPHCWQRHLPILWCDVVLIYLLPTSPIGTPLQDLDQSSSSTPDRIHQKKRLWECPSITCSESC
jgi:hypothetical protein